MTVWSKRLSLGCLIAYRQLKLADCILLKDEIFQFDDRIRYFGFLDNRQGMVVSELKNKSESHASEERLVRDLTFFKGAMASWGLYFGRVRYSVVAHDSLKIIMIPIETGLLIITAEPSFSLTKVEEISEKLHERSLTGKV